MLGTLWSLPTTTVGLVYGLIGVPFGADVSISNGAIHFNNHPLNASAVSLGLAIIYKGGDNFSPDSPRGPGNLAGEEIMHIGQARVFGPFYLPIHIIAQALSYLTTGNTHGAGNPFEYGPHPFDEGGHEGQPLTWPWQ